MKSENRFSLSKRVKSFSYAWAGIVALIRYEHNARIHLVAAVVAVALGVVLHISTHEWLAIVISIGAVISAEAMNSAVEAVCDKVSEERDDLIKRAKDCAAAAVLIVAMMAAIVGGVIFIPKLLHLINGAL